MLSINAKYLTRFRGIKRSASTRRREGDGFVALLKP